MTLAETQLSSLLGNALIEPSGPGYEQERKVVEQLRNSLTISQAVLLVGYAHGVAETSEPARALVTEAGEAHMSPFNAGENLNRRFAAAAVIDLVQSYRGLSPVAAALAATALSRIELSPVVDELQPIVAASLARLAENRRAVSFDPLSVQPFPPSRSGELPPEGAEQVTSTALREAVQGERNAIRGAANNADKRIRQLERISLRNSEEIDLLWWTLDPFSDHLAGWSQAKQPATLVAALEVGRRLLIDPPPRGTRRVLTEALNKAGVDPDDQLTLASVVAEVPAPALSDPQVRSSNLSWATPVLSWIRHQADGGDAPSGGEVAASRLDWATQLVADLSLTRVMA
jgi:hypothetical protein